jgi:hypothetical protein
MSITDKMVHVAACEYLGLNHDYDIPSGNLRDMRRALEAAMQAAWTKFDIDGELPTTFTNVLVIDAKEGQHVAFYNAEYCQWFSVCNRQLYDVIYWMPLLEYVGEL